MLNFLAPENLRLIVAVSVLNVPAYILMWWAFFGGWGDFTAALYFWFSPTWLDWLRGDTEEDGWQHAKVLVFLLLCSLMVASESINIHRKLPGLATMLSGAVPFSLDRDGDLGPIRPFTGIPGGMTPR